MYASAVLQTGAQGSTQSESEDHQGTETPRMLCLHDGRGDRVRARDSGSWEPPGEGIPMPLTVIFPGFECAKDHLEGRDLPPDLARPH